MAPSLRNSQLALLFDMNSLWEEYVLVQLKKAARNEEEFEVFGQRSKRFWQNISIRPDIVIKKGKETLIIDTKWKNIQNSKPSTQDLRQMYVYNDYWESVKAMLLYPSTETIDPDFRNFRERGHQCAVGRLNIIKEGKLNLRYWRGDPRLVSRLKKWKFYSDLTSKSLFYYYL